MEAIILAGGFGTRLSSTVKNLPKPMAPVCNRPFLRYVLDMLHEQGFNRVVLATGYLSNQISDYFGLQYKNLSLHYSVEQEPLGTGGAIKRALSYCSEETVAVLAGDSFFEIDLIDAFDTFMQTQDAEVLLAVKKMALGDRYGSLLIEDNRIIEFSEKSSCLSGMINGGIYVLRRDVFENMPDEFSLEHEYFERFAGQKCFVPYESTGFFLDIGVPSDYALAQSLFEARAPRNQRIAFFDRDGTINVDVGHLFEPEKMELIPSTINIMKQFQDKGYRLVVVTNQAGIAKGLYNEDDMHRLHNELSKALSVLSVYVEAYYFCPHHPDYTGECECRKPRAGLLKKALFDFEAQPENCVLFGDKQTDIEAASQCGIEAHLVAPQR